MRRWSGGGSDAGLAAVVRRLAAWRRAHGGRGRRLPEAVWDDAVRLAREGELSAVARALRLRPEALARRVRSAGRGPAREAPPTFVEVSHLPACRPSDGGGCQVELVAPDGARVTVQLRDPTAVDLVALAGGLLRAVR